MPKLKKTWRKNRGRPKQRLSQPRKQSKRQYPQARRSAGRSWVHRGLWALATFLLAHVTGSFLNLWGPLWPTKPEIELETPSFSGAFTIPFYVRNRSAIFDLENLTLTCDLVVEPFDRPVGTVVMGEHPIRSDTLTARHRRHFQCNIARDRDTSIGVVFSARYEINLGPFAWPRILDIGYFRWEPNLRPPRWIEIEAL